MNAPLWQTAAGLFIFFALLIGIFYYLYWRTHLRGRKSPFSGLHLAKGEEILYSSAEKISLFFSELPETENASIDMSKASFCKKTGRIFPNTINSFDQIDVSLNYLKAYYSSKLTPWFRLSEEDKDAILRAHDSLDGFQMGKGIKPGPLFVDKKNKTLVGWKQVPGTEMEVLVTQKIKEP